MSEELKERLLESIRDYCDAILDEEQGEATRAEYWQSVLGIADEWVNRFVAIKDDRDALLVTIGGLQRFIETSGWRVGSGDGPATTVTLSTTSTSSGDGRE